MTELSSPGRVYFPGAGITKQDYADYLSQVCEAMLPHVARRPLSLVRCPGGVEKQCFFQKHHAKGMPDGFKPVKIKEKDGGKEPYVFIDDIEGLKSCAQFGALELHPWGSTIDDIERPERIIFDLDPDEGLDFSDVKDAARDIKDLLESAGLSPYPMLTGGKGVHVIAPLEPKAGWDGVKAFCRGLATALADNQPARYTAQMSKAKRKGRIFIDWLRNQRGQTSVAPYSVRARKGAPVATPIRWDELSKAKSGADYDVESLPRRLSSMKSDPWKDYFDDAKPLSKGAISWAKEAGGD
ncbi:MAG: non-homologous end-joining DNA ligase [Oceanicaulis sp.]